MADASIVREWLRRADENFAASRKEPSLSAISDRCEFLNTAYIDTRYPVH